MPCYIYICIYIFFFSLVLFSFPRVGVPAGLPPKQQKGLCVSTQQRKKDMNFFSKRKVEALFFYYYYYCLAHIYMCDLVNELIRKAPPFLRFLHFFFFVFFSTYLCAGVVFSSLFSLFFFFYFFFLWEAPVCGTHLHFHYLFRPRQHCPRFTPFEQNCGQSHRLCLLRA